MTSEVLGEVSVAEVFCPPQTLYRIFWNVTIFCVLRGQRVSTCNMNGLEGHVDRDIKY